jgi:Zn-dependent M28 family amino/carboxypeptidase
MVADVNVDMFLPIQPIRGITAYGMEESNLADVLQRVARDESLRVVPDPEPQRLYFVRSDQIAFVRRGIPAVMLDAGPVDSAGRAREAEWNRTHYHAPSDDASQEIDLAAAARFDRYVLAVTRTVADGDRAPRWNSKSPFRRYRNDARR